jgi:acetylornithine deacetylase/succinyl-diaminopimelate desuccinylase-like protein
VRIFRHLWRSILTLFTARAATAGGAPASGAAREHPIDYDALRDETVRAMSEYLRIDTTNPPGNELAAARWLQTFLAKEGIRGAILDTAELGSGRANFYARFAGDGSKKAIALVHHMDVVPADPARWSVPPFSGVVKDGYIWGRGALDMKSQGIIHLLSMVALKRAGVPLTRDIVFIANADEEVHGSGATVFTRRHPDLLADVEYLITEGEGTRVEDGVVKWFAVGVAEKRAYCVRLVAHGTAAHGSIPRADNPVPRLARAVERVAAWETPIRLLPSVDRFLEAQAMLEEGEHRAWLANAAAALQTPRGRAYILSDPYRNAILRTTIAPTVFTGSTRTNIIPPTASAELDVRLLPDEDPIAFRRELARVIGDDSIDIEALPGVMPGYSATLDTVLVRAVEQEIGALLPGVLVTTPLGAGATDRPTYGQMGIEAYGVEPYIVEDSEEARGVHGIDERLSVVNIGFGLKLITGVIRRMQ